MNSAGQPWFVYLLSCRDSSLYCGMTKDLDRRLDQHNRGRAGAKYTRTRRPVTLVYVRQFPDRTSAARFEYHLKRLDRADKLKLIGKGVPTEATSLPKPCNQRQ